MPPIKARGNDVNQANSQPFTRRQGWKRILGLLLFIVAALTVVILPQLGHKEVSLQIRATHNGLATPDGFLSIKSWTKTASVSPASHRIGRGWSYAWRIPNRGRWRCRYCSVNYRPVIALPIKSCIARCFIKASAPLPPPFLTALATTANPQREETFPRRSSRLG